MEAQSEAWRLRLKPGADEGHEAEAGRARKEEEAGPGERPLSKILKSYGSWGGLDGLGGLAGSPGSLFSYIN